MNNPKKILPILLVLLFSAFVILIIVFQKSKKPFEVAAPTTTQNKAKENPDIFFASNGKNTVYKIKKGNQWAVIWNGQEGKLYDFVSNPVFSADGTQIAYNAEINGQAYVVINNTQEINAYQKANYITFSKDGSTIAFVATKNDNSYVVISAKIQNITETLKESKSFKEIVLAQGPDGNSSALIMNDDGSKIAYVIKENDKVYVIVNGQKSQGYDDILSFSFSKDGNSFTYKAQNGNTTLVVTNNQVISSTNNSSSQSVSSSDGNSTTNNQNITYPSSTYRYKITTKKDVKLDPDRFDYSTCSTGSQCNF